jgi:hypothetical protein
MEAPNTTLIVDYLLGEGPGSDNPGDSQLRVCDDDWGPEYRQQRLLSARFVVAMRPRHPAANQEMTLDLYLSLPHLRTSTVGVRMIDEWLAREGLSRRIAVTIPSLAGVIGVFVDRHGIRALTHFRCSYRLRRGNKASAEQVELCSAVHLPFDELQLCDLPLGLTVGPRLGHRRGDGGPIGDDALAEGGEDTAGSISDPGRQSIWITVTHHSVEARDQVAG